MNNPTFPVKVLVIARSARMLAQLAVGAGFQPIAIDCFADTDTQLLALQSVRVDSLELDDMRDSVESVTALHGLTHVIYGSGFEAHLDSLHYLQTRFVVLGNPVVLLQQLQDKPAFFSQLAQLDISYPESIFSAPEDAAGWLVKPMCGEGGVGVSVFAHDKHVDGKSVYWQRRVSGAVFSALFLASRGCVKLMGFNRQWPIDADAGNFVFAGIGNHAQLSAENRLLIAEWLEKLVTVYPLQGLASVDFILHDEQCYLLEINPRIPASAQLYGWSILALHCQACAGFLGEIPTSPPRAYQVIFAVQDTAIPAGMTWPVWAVDRPAAGAFVGKGQPVCSIIADGIDADQVVTRLRHQKNIIEQLLNTGF